MSRSSTIAGLRGALALSGLLLSLPALSEAQSLERGLHAAGAFSETSLDLPFPGSGEPYRLGGSLTAGFELVGVPDVPWHFDLAGRYLVLPSSGEGALGLAGPELRVGYSFALGKLADLAPIASLALLYPIARKADRSILLEAGFKLDLYLGNWAWLSLVPRCSYLIGTEAPVSLGLGLGFKQLVAWGKARALRAATQEANPSEPSAPDSSRPSLRIGIDAAPTLFSPDEDGKNDLLSIRPSIDLPQFARSWEIAIDDPNGQLFYSRSGKGPPPSSLTWDGKSSNGELVESAADYTIRLSVVDEGERRSQAQAAITTDVLVIRQGSRYKIRLPSILFPADSAQLAQNLDDSFMRQNLQILNRLALIFQRFPDYRITIEGHANLVNWSKAALAAIEERDSSGPLSLQRAQTVKKALIQLGIQAERIKAIGRGGQYPLYPGSDAVNSWKNRRVEIFLDR